MKLSAGRVLTAALALAYQVEANSSLNNHESGNDIERQSDGEITTKMVWIRGDTPVTRTSGHYQSTSKHPKASGNVVPKPSSETTKSQPTTSGNPAPEHTSHTSSKPVAPDTTTQRSSAGPKGAPKSQSTSGNPAPEHTSHSSSNPPAPDTSSQRPADTQTSSKAKGHGGGGKPSSSPKNSDSSNKDTTTASEGSTKPLAASQAASKTTTSDGGDATPKPSGHTKSQGPTTSSKHHNSDYTELAGPMVITSGGHTTTEAALIPYTTIQVTKDHDTSSIVMAGTSVTTSKGSKPTFAWGCVKKLSDLCGTGLHSGGGGGGGGGGCLVPLLFPHDSNWGLGGGWSPAGNPPPGGPSDPPKDPNDPDNDDHKSTKSKDDDESTSEKTTSTTDKTTATRTTSSASSTTSASKFRLCLNVKEGDEEATTTESTASSTRPATSSATPTSASKFRLCLNVKEGDEEATETGTTTHSTITGSGTRTTLTSAAKTTSEAPPKCTPHQDPHMKDGTWCYCEGSDEHFPTMTGEDMCGWKTIPAKPKSTSNSPITSTKANGEVLRCASGDYYDYAIETTPTCDGSTTVLSTITSMASAYSASVASEFSSSSASKASESSWSAAAATPSAKCYITDDDGLGDSAFEIVGINGWAGEDGDKLDVQEDGCGWIDNWHWHRHDKAKFEGRWRETEYVSFSLSFFKGGCVERAIKSAGGPDITCHHGQPSKRDLGEVDRSVDEPPSPSPTRQMRRAPRGWLDI